MKIIVADFSMTGMAHMYFNGAFLKILSQIYSQPLFFYGEESHVNYVSQQLEHFQIKYISYKSKNRLGFGVVFQDISNIHRICKLLLKSSENDIIFILNRLPITLIACNLINKILKRRVLNILHGELEYLVNPNMKGGSKYYYKLFKIGYKLSNNFVSYIFLGESIRKIVIDNNISFGKGKLLSIDHPYDYNSMYFSHNEISFPKCKIGIIGSAMRRKNSHYIIELAKKCKNSKAIFYITGKVDDYLSNECKKLNIHTNAKTQSNDDYIKKNMALDYSLCFYDDKINIALASGSFFDSIKYCKPILALGGNPFVDYYFNRLGNIGYRFDNIQEIAEFLNKLSIDEIVKYNNQVENLKLAQNQLSIDNISSKFKDDLKLNGYD